MQDEIAQIEADFEELDKKNMWSPNLVHNGTFREEHEQERTNLLGLLANKLKTFSEFCFTIGISTLPYPHAHVTPRRLCSARLRPGSASAQVCSTCLRTAAQSRPISPEIVNF
jgi:hypothetical protein